MHRFILMVARLYEVFNTFREAKRVPRTWDCICYTADSRGLIVQGLLPGKPECNRPAPSPAASTTARSERQPVAVLDVAACLLLMILPLCF